MNAGFLILLIASLFYFGMGIGTFLRFYEHKMRMRSFFYIIILLPIETIVLSVFVCLSVSIKSKREDELSLWDTIGLFAFLLSKSLLTVAGRLAQNSIFKSDGDLIQPLKHEFGEYADYRIRHGV